MSVIKFSTFPDKSVLAIVRNDESKTKLPAGTYIMLKEFEKPDKVSIFGSGRCITVPASDDLEKYPEIYRIYKPRVINCPPEEEINPVDILYTRVDKLYDTYKPYFDILRNFTKSDSVAITKGLSAGTITYDGEKYSYLIDKVARVTSVIAKDGTVGYAYCSKEDDLIPIIGVSICLARILDIDLPPIEFDVKAEDVTKCLAKYAEEY